MVRGSQNRERRWKSDPQGMDCPICAAHVHGQLKVKAKLLHLNTFHADAENLAVFNGFMGVHCLGCPACSKICLDSGRHQRTSAAGTECYRQWSMNHVLEASQASRFAQDSETEDDQSLSQQVVVGIPSPPPSPAPTPINDAPAPRTRSSRRNETPEPLAAARADTDDGSVTNGPPPGLPTLPAATGRTTFLRSELMDLIAIYGKYALYVIHWTWRERTARITKAFMDEIKDSTDPAHSGRSEVASAALLLLPGVLHAMVKHRLGKTADLMKTLDEYPHSPAKFHILEARNLPYTYRTATTTQRGQPEDIQISHAYKTNHACGKLVIEGRLSAATVQVGVMDAMLHRQDYDEAPPETGQFSSEEAAAVLRRYNPEGRPERDSLPDWDPDEHAPLQLKDAQVRDAIRAVNSQASAGYSAWTFALIRALAETTVPNMEGSWISSLTSLFNLMLRNRLSREWWTPSRAVLLPKGDDAWGPLGKGDAFYRILGKAIMIAIGDRVGKEIRPIQLGVGTSGGSEINRGHFRAQFAQTATVPGPVRGCRLKCRFFGFGCCCGRRQSGID